MKTRTFLWAAALCAAALLLARCAEEQIPVQPEIPVEELAEDPETRAMIVGAPGIATVGQKITVSLSAAPNERISYSHWSIRSGSPSATLTSTSTTSASITFHQYGYVIIDCTYRDQTGSDFNAQISVNVYANIPDDVNITLEWTPQNGQYKTEDQLAFRAVPTQSGYQIAGAEWTLTRATMVSGGTTATPLIRLTEPGEATILCRAVISKAFHHPKTVTQYIRIPGVVFNLSAPLIGLNHRDQISTPEGFGVNVANTSWPVTVSMFDHSGDPNATYEWIVPPGVILTDGNRFPLNRPLQPTDKTVYALHPTIGTYIWQGRIRYGNGQVTEWGQRTVTVVADPLPPAPFKIRFETEYSFYVNIMIELEHGGYVDLLGETSETYGGYTPYEYEEWVDLPPGNHILYFSTEGGAVNEARPFSLPEDGAEYYFYYGTWGHGGSPTLSSRYSRF